MAFFARRVFGSRLKNTAERAKNLDLALRRSGLMVPVDAYVSFMALVALIVFFGALLNGFMLGYVVTRSLVFAGLIAFVAGLVASMISTAFAYVYPNMMAGKKRRSVDESLPYAVSFMAILSTAGVPPNRVFKTLAMMEQRKQVGLGGEARVIYRDMEALGEDIISTLKAVSDRKISVYFSGLLEGVISTIRSGGDLTSYLEEEGKSLMRLRRSIMKEFLETMTMVSEMFMALMVAFPLIMIVMLVVMSSIGGGSIGGSRPETIVPLIIYGMIPASGLVILLLIDSITPK
ncbi:MAG: type II secretion system F family protein [Thaumarchaeota archaeon]|nr:type II secretion system F family protein [Nitrososphaerota archaeon]